MPRKVDKKLPMKITFWISVPTVMFIIGAIRTDMLGYAVRVHRSRDHVKRGVADDKAYEDITEIVDPAGKEHYSLQQNHNPEKYTTLLNGQNTEQVKGTDELGMENVLQFPKRNKTTHVAFLKVHKAGSTTIQNMLFRFGLKHDLNIILPKSFNLMEEKSQVMPIEPDQHFDMFAVHTAYNKLLFDSLLPADYVSFAIVRSPVDRMISAAYYHRDVHHVKYLRMIPRANFVHNLVNYPEHYDRAVFSQTRNTMARDFGFSTKMNQNDKIQIRNYLGELNEQFKLVMVMEMIDESLVLLRRLLGWSVDDIIYLQANNHAHHAVVLNRTEETKFRETSSFDFDVYNYFSEIFNEKLKKESNDFWDEVAQFKQLIHSVGEYCLDTKVTVDYYVKATKWNEYFSITKSDCEWMNTKELKFIAKLRERHNNRHNISNM